MPAAEQGRLALIAVFASIVLLVSALVGLHGVAAYAAPMLALLVPLLAGRFPGEERMVRALRFARRRARPSRRVSRSLAPPRPPVVFPRGSDLIGASLAVRPPPLLLSA